MEKGHTYSVLFEDNQVVLGDDKYCIMYMMEKSILEFLNGIWRLN